LPAALLETDRVRNGFKQLSQREGLHMHRLPLLIVSLATLASCAASGGPQTAAAGGARECFNVRSVNSFTPAGRDAVNVRVGANRYFRLDILGTCPDIDFSMRVGVRPRAGSSWICQGQDADLVVPSPSGTQVCPVLGVRRLSDVEVQALRARRHR
jgi:hypothetical protein